jgi:2-oxoacid:acceptor oxidoreductase delta subunit (pyruvate/2-ketoisovalerate family)
MPEKKSLLGPVALVFTSARTGAWRILRPVVDLEKCKFCDLCQKFCPTDVVEIRGKKPDRELYFDLDYCKGCGICADVCPQDSISMVPERKQS